MSTVVVNGRPVKLGKRATRRDHRTLRLANYLTSKALPAGQGRHPSTGRRSLSR